MFLSPIVVFRNHSIILCRKPFAKLRLVLASFWPQIENRTFALSAASSDLVEADLRCGAASLGVSTSTDVTHGPKPPSVAVVTAAVQLPQSRHRALLPAIAAVGLKTDLKNVLQLTAIPVVLIFAETVFLALVVLAGIIILGIALYASPANDGLLR